MNYNLNNNINYDEFHTNSFKLILSKNSIDFNQVRIFYSNTKNKTLLINFYVYGHLLFLAINLEYGINPLTEIKNQIKDKKEKLQILLFKNDNITFYKQHKIKFLKKQYALRSLYYNGTVIQSTTIKLLNDIDKLNNENHSSEYIFDIIKNIEFNDILEKKYD